MSLLPKIKRCPCCKRFNLVVTNGISYDNVFHSMADWTIKKIFNCRKCRVELGLFIHNVNKKEKNIENQKQYNKTLDDINLLYNKIRAEQIKVKIKVKIELKGILIGHVY